MTTGAGASGASAFLQHLTRYPEDLRDIRRLRRRYRLSTLEVARALARITPVERKPPNRDEGERSKT
jgi:hypothetical protein